MLTAYLDQNKWIDLARAETGHPLGAPFSETLEVFKEAVDSGRVRFPLSAAHYYETGKQTDRRKRMELAKTMTRLAGTLRIAPPHVIVPWELRRALIDVFDLPHSVPDIELFGSGVGQAFGAPTLRYTAPTEWQGVQLPPEARAELERRATPVFEEMVLASVMPEGVPDEMRVVFSDFKNLTADRFVEGQEEVAQALRTHGRQRLTDIMLATAYTDIRALLTHALIELGVSPPEVASSFKEILDATPSRWVEMKLRHQRQANPQQRWEGNDLNDVTALSIAVPYCDIVVTERSWSAMLNAATVPQRLGTTVTRSLRDLVDMVNAGSPDPTF